MDKVTKYRAIVYELKEKQEKYYCVIYVDEEGAVLYRTGYFSSASGAVSRAKKFIDDYHGSRKSNDENYSEERVN